MSLTLALPFYQTSFGTLVQALKIAHSFSVERGVELHFADHRYAPHLVSRDWATMNMHHDGVPTSEGYLFYTGYNAQSFMASHEFEASHRFMGEIQ